MAKSLSKKIKEMEQQALDELIEWCGGQSETARLLNRTPQAVSCWVAAGRISKKSAVEAERQTKGVFTAKQLRPTIIDWRS